MDKIKITAGFLTLLVYVPFVLCMTREMYDAYMNERLLLEGDSKEAMEDDDLRAEMDFNDLNIRLQNTDVLDPQEKFTMHWRVDSDRQVITIEIAVETKGWVCLGISPGGTVSGADLLIGWVDDEGQVHIQDRHGTDDNTMLLDDNHQDWNLLRALENDTHTIMIVRRDLNTCDSQDLPITSTTRRIIYAYADEDPPNDTTTTALSFGPPGDVMNGSYYLAFMQTPTARAPPSDASSTWSLHFNHTLSKGEKKVHWCNIERFEPEAGGEGRQVHYIGFDLRHGQNSEVHLRQVIIYKCAGEVDSTTYHLQRARLNHYASQDRGHACYNAHNTPSDYSKCNLVVILWTSPGTTSGGRQPDHVDLPLLLPNDGTAAFFMVEAQYDNGNSVHDLNVQWHVEIYYKITDDGLITPQPHLRRYDSGILRIGSSVNFATVIPPGQRSWTTAGHCPAGCLMESMPESGIKVFQVLMQMHSLGKQIRIRHFRDGIELEPIAYDEFFDVNFQLTIYLAEERTVLPGDHLTTECTYKSNTQKNVTFSGYGRVDETCTAFLFYYPRISLAECSSAPHHDVIKSLFHIEQIQNEENLLLQSSNQENTNPHLPKKNHFFQDYMNNLEWSELDLKKTQNELYTGTQVTRCLKTGGAPAQAIKLKTGFPEAMIYEAPQSHCPSIQSLKSTSATMTASMDSVLAAFLVCVTHLIAQELGF